MLILLPKPDKSEEYKVYSDFLKIKNETNFLEYLNFAIKKLNEQIIETNEELEIYRLQGAINMLKNLTFSIESANIILDKINKRA